MEELRCEDCGKLLVKYELYYGRIEAKCYRCNAMNNVFENLFTVEVMQI